jgi:hypothetical protein
MDASSFRRRFALASDFRLLEILGHAAIAMQWILVEFEREQVAEEIQCILIDGANLIASQREAL